MADQEKDTRTSRRAARRARAQTGEGEREAPATVEPSKSTPSKPTRDRNQRVRERARAERRARRGEPAEEVVRGLDAGEMVDDAFARATHTTVQWVRHHSTLVQWLLVVLVVGFVGWRVVLWRITRGLENASDRLMDAVEAEDGTVGDLPALVQPQEIDTRAHFNSDAERLQRAEELYRKAAAGKASAATTTLAKLGLAGVLYDLRKFDQALTGYREVKASALAGHDPEVRARAIEGMGLCLEAKGDKDGALGAFHELEASEVREYQALGLYQQARMRFAKGERDQAKQLLAKLAEKTKKPESTDKSAPPPKPDFVERAAEELQLAMDPKGALDKPGLGGVGQEEDQMAQLRRMLEQMQRGRGGGKLPAMPARPVTPRPASSQ